MAVLQSNIDALGRIPMHGGGGAEGYMKNECCAYLAHLLGLEFGHFVVQNTEYILLISIGVLERPQWLEIKSVNQLKTKLGHVIVMLLLIGLFDKSKKAIILSPFDLLCFSASVFVSSACLYLLSKLKGSK
ncbi:hypothetical protein LguiA_033740 [Lonicera macranthoides]